MENERLEKLSDLVRHGVSIGFSEAIEVIEYQESKKAHRTTEDMWFGAKLLPQISKLTSHIFKRCAKNRFLLEVI